MAWTAEQQSAIDIPVADTIVSAAAGSGKTAVMTERIVKRVIAGYIDIDRLLIVTFTNAAAAEIKSRLMEKIMDELDKTQNNDVLNRQLLLINNASICTIHSFCLNIIKNNFYALSLDPEVKIGDENEMKLLRADILDKIFDSYYENNDIEFLDLVNCYTKKNDKDLMEFIYKIYNFSMSIPDGIEYLEDIAKKFENDTVGIEYMLNSVNVLASKAHKLSEKAVNMCAFDEDFAKVYAMICDERNMFEKLLGTQSWDDCYKILHSFEFSRWSTPKSADPQTKAEVKRLRDTYKDIYNKLKKKISFVSEKEIFEDMKIASKHVKKLVEITKKLHEEFSKAKRDKNTVDFSDFEHLALKLLKNKNGTPTEIAKKLQAKYDEIYIDEYQDCNGVQEAIFSLISGKYNQKPNMFMVGDMKQSIYKFRDADPGLFKQKSDSYTMYSGNLGDYNKIFLNKNFRSRQSVLNCVNSIFCQLMNEQCGELEYTKDEFLYYNDGSYRDTNEDLNYVDVAIIDCAQQSNDYSDYTEAEEKAYETASKDTIEDLKDIEAEAVYVARRIKSMVECGTYTVFDKSANTYRPIRYSDIVILLRSVKSKAEVFGKIFNDYDIPMYCDVGGGYYDTTEITFLISVLKIIDNPYDDVSLLSVMRHPVFGFDENDFVKIRIADTDGFMYSAIVQYIENNNDELAKRLVEFKNALTYFYERSTYLSSDKLLWDIVYKTNYMEYLSFAPNSELKKANVKALFNRAFEFEQSDYKGIFNFVRYIELLKQNNNDTETAKVLGEGENLVRLMSIHKSKGLEFPVVFLCNSSKQFNMSDTNSQILLHKKFGLGVKFIDYKKRVSYPLPILNAISDSLQNEIISEEMRILYVALTRAREKLIITGTVKNAEKTFEKIASEIIEEDYKIDPMITLKHRNYLDWIIMAIIRKSTLNLAKGYMFENACIDEAKYNVSVISKSSLDINEKQEDKKVDFDTLKPKENMNEFVKNRLEYKYPYENLVSMPSNISVTELKRMEMEREEVYNPFVTDKLPIPQFLKDEITPSAANIGTFTHLVMEKLDFSDTDTLNAIENQITILVDKGFLTKANASYINAKNIFRLFSTELGKKMQTNAKNINREFSFKYLVNASEINPDLNCDDKVIVQGMIDAYFEDKDGEIIIVDYKTDKIKNKIDDIKKRYATQLNYYSNALENALSKKVKKKYLFLLDIGEVVEI